ncbi:ATP-binding cassette domain-containing protein [Spiroplasma endosymbiont of Polydrusus formosus]
MVGPNGTGKTTLCKILAQLLRYTSSGINEKSNIGFKLECKSKNKNIPT